MNGCPICKGTLITKTSSAGQEIYCNDCRNIIVSSTLGFKFAFGDEGDMDVYGDDTAEETTGYDAEPEGQDDDGGGGGAAIEQCFLNGLPGWKGSGEKSHCYTYPPGSKKDEEKAKRKATESAYMETREAHIKKIANEYFSGPVAFGVTGVGTPGLDKPKPPFTTDTLAQEPSYLNDFAPTAGRKQSIAMLNDFCTHSNPETCSQCGVTH